MLMYGSFKQSISAGTSAVSFFPCVVQILFLISLLISPYSEFHQNFERGQNLKTKCIDRNCGMGIPLTESWQTSLDYQMNLDQTHKINCIQILSRLLDVCFEQSLGTVSTCYSNGSGVQTMKIQVDMDRNTWHRYITR